VSAVCVCVQINFEEKIYSRKALLGLLACKSVALVS